MTPCCELYKDSIMKKLFQQEEYYCREIASYVWAFDWHIYI